VKLGPSPRVHAFLNKTHFTMKEPCDETCNVCRSFQIPYQCQSSPAGDTSVGTSHGPIPEIKKNGFVAFMHSTANCNGEAEVAMFYTDGICTNGFSNSQLSSFNVETKHAEIFSYSKRDCIGDVTNKLSFPLDVCSPMGGSGGFVLIKKP
jgi:hypothetical protein